MIINRQIHIFKSMFKCVNIWINDINVVLKSILILVAMLHNNNLFHNVV